MKFFSKNTLIRECHQGADPFKRSLKLDCSLTVDALAGHGFRQVCNDCDGILIIKLLPGCRSLEHKRLSVQVSCELKLGQGSAGAELSPKAGATEILPLCFSPGVRRFGERIPRLTQCSKGNGQSKNLYCQLTFQTRRDMSREQKHKMAANM